MFKERGYLFGTNNFNQLQQMINTTRLFLSELNINDLDNIHHLHSLQEVDEYNTLGLAKLKEETQALLDEWIKLQNQDPRMNFTFKIVLKDSDEFIGLMALKLGKPHYRIAEVWYKILPDFWNQGFAPEALSELLNFGFNELGLHRIEAGCAVENLRSIRVLEKVGMKKEGHHRKILPIRGNWVDNFSFAILEEEFKPL